MINSHYIPQFLLRHFCVDDHIHYCNIESKRAETRTTRTVFSGKGYYPEELEHDLCVKIETQFANLLNNKIVKEKREIVLSDAEMLLLKKYLILSVLRVKTDELAQNLNELGFSPKEIETFGGNFYENIKKVLDCRTKEEVFRYCALDSEMTNANLYAYMKDILYSFTLFVKTDNCKEDFIIPDRGCACYEGPIHELKHWVVLDVARETGDPYMFQVARMLTPHDYSVFPLTHDLAVMTISFFFRILAEAGPHASELNTQGFTFSDMLGFGSRKLIKPPVLKRLPGNKTEYHCGIRQLTKQDVVFLNSLLLSNADRFFAFGDTDKVEQSITQYGKYDFALMH